MEVRKGYKQTEVGVIPEDWEVKKLSELTTLMTNGFVGTATTHYTEFDDGVLYIQGFNVEENAFNFTGIKRVTQEFHKKHSKSCLQEGDLLTIQTGEVGLTTIVPKELAGANCHALIITRFRKEKTDPYYFAYYLNAHQGRTRLREIETGSTMKHINVGDMVHFNVSLPPTRAEQTAIATTLSDADALIQSLEKLIAKKRNIKQGAMQELLKSKEGWVVKKLGEIFSISAGGDLRKDEFSSVKDEKYCYPIYSNALTNAGLYGFCSLFDYDGNCITVTARGTVGFANYRDHKFSAIGRLLILKPIEKLNCFFIAEYINLKVDFANESTGVPQLTAPQISKYEVVLPDYTDQTRIATILNDMDAEISTLGTKLAKYKQIKQGMMQVLLTGKTRLV